MGGLGPEKDREVSRGHSTVDTSLKKKSGWSHEAGRTESLIKDQLLDKL